MTDINTWFFSLPPVTRNYLAATSILTILVSLNVFSPYSVVFISDEVIKNFQIWRIFTSFGFFGKFGFNWLFDMAFLVISTRTLELMPMFLNNPKSFYWMIFCEIIIILLCAWLFTVYLLGEVLVFSFLYIGCRYEPERIYTLLWGFQVQGLYLPFVILGFRLLSGVSIIGELIGMALGELVFFVKESVPEKYGFDILNPPEWFNQVVQFTERMIALYIRPAVQVREQPRDQPRNAPFAGRGYRLG